MPQTGRGQKAVHGSSSTRPTKVRRPPASPAAALIEIADTLYRTAGAACSEHRRYADLVEREASDAEQKSARSARGGIEPTWSGQLQRNISDTTRARIA